MEEIAAGVEGIVALVGFAEPAAGGGDFRHAHNALAVLADGAVRTVYRKNRLPNYAVFDEQRYFIPGTEAATVDVAGARVGLTVCEDCWVEGPPASTEVAEGATLIANPSGSPYHRGKGREREELFASLARSYGVHFAFCNLVGGQDELVFDGQSLVFDPTGAVLARAAQFEEELLVCDLDSPAPRSAWPSRSPISPRSTGRWSSASATTSPRTASSTSASPSRGASTRPSSRCSRSMRSAPIASPAWSCPPLIPALQHRGTHELSPRTSGSRRSRSRSRGRWAPTTRRCPAACADGNLAAENIQARIRGNMMMALSNKHGWLVLTTGNKSEMSVGYATLYGDMAGGFAAIKDVPKTLVYELVRYRNAAASGEPIPASVIERPPSAELRPDQFDSDSLPPYDLLDRVLEAYVERDQGREEMVAAGMPAEVVDEVVRMVDRAEYKRRQAAPGIRITPRAFGRDRRLPITNRFGG